MLSEAKPSPPVEELLLLTLMVKLAVYSSKDFIWDKKDLLVPAAPAKS